MAHFWMIAFFIPSVFCAEGNNLRNQQRVNLAPGAGGYGSNDMEDNYDYILDDTPPRGEVERLLKDYMQNQELVMNLGNRYYQVIYPIQMRRQGLDTRDRRNQGYGKFDTNLNSVNRIPGMDQPRKQKHYRRTSLLIKAFQHKFRLDLELNTRLLAPNIQKREFLKEGATSISQQDIEECYYHGTVKDYHGSDFIPGSMAALQTCNGVSGIVHLGNETFVIHPFYGGDLSNKHPHIIYEFSDKSPQGCALDTNYGNYGSRSGGYNSRRKRDVPSSEKDSSIDIESLIDPLPSSPRSFLFEEDTTQNLLRMRKNINDLLSNVTNSGKSKRDVRDSKKFIELALIIDKAMFDKRPHSKRKDVIHDAIQVANIADLYFKQSLGPRLSIVYLESWKEQDQLAGFKRQRDISAALGDFQDYLKRKLYKVDRDSSQLLTGQTFKNGRSTIATQGKICTDKSAGISVDINPFEPHILAANLAHAIGHNMGFSHDNMGGNRDCNCQDWHGCIMKPTVIGEEGIQPYKFSSCSRKQFNGYLEDGRLLCLLNNPNEPSYAKGGSNCGNGFVDSGEECDCGSINECNNNCCDPITCRFKQEAQCASGECCDVNTCKVYPRGYECRSARSECDLPEICNGYTGQCPKDLYVKNTTPCSRGKGYCIEGVCPTMDQQCSMLWGNTGRKAGSQCFSEFNSRGTQTGNCGKTPYNTYKPCEVEHLECGTLHCQGGRDRPDSMFQNVDYHATHTQTGADGKKYQCKMTSGVVDPETNDDWALVADGTVCGPPGTHKICMNQTCVSIGPMIGNTLQCPRNNQNEECSGNGRCSNINTCVCDPGFMGRACDMPSDIIDMPTLSPEITPSPDETPSATVSHTHIQTDSGQVTSTTAWKAEAIPVQETQQNTVLLVIVLVVCVASIFACFAMAALCYRRKSALPKYTPPYNKRQMMKGYSHPNSPHPSQITPDHTFDGGIGSKMSLSGMGQTTLDRQIPGHGPIPPPPPAGGQGPGVGNYPGGTLHREHSLHHMKQQFGTLGRMNGHHDSRGFGGSSTMLAESGYPEKGGILKKSGAPYGPMDHVSSLDREKWLEENADRLSRMDRLSTSSQNQLASAGGGQSVHGVMGGQQQGVSTVDMERTLKSLNGYHEVEGLLEALRSAAASANAVQGQNQSSHRGSQSSSGPASAGPHPPSGPAPFGLPANRSSAASLTEELRKTLESNYLDGGFSTGLPGSGGGQHKTSSREKLEAAAAVASHQHTQGVLGSILSGSGNQGNQGGVGGPSQSGGEQPGPIRIRNLEDLIRQLEHSSRHLSSSPGSDEMAGGEHDRHFSAVSRTLSQGHEDQAFGIVGPYQAHHHNTQVISSSSTSNIHRRPSTDEQHNSSRGGGERTSTAISPAASHGSTTSSLRIRRHHHHHGSKRGLSSPPPRQSERRTGVVPPPPPRQPHTPIHFGASSSQQTGGGHGASGDRPGTSVGGADPSGVETVSNGGGGFTPGSAFDTDIDSEDYLRAQLMRSASDEGLGGLKSDDLEDDVDSIRSPFYKPRTPLRYPLSPQSPPSDESSYQGSIPGSAPSDRSYNGGGPDPRGDGGRGHGPNSEPSYYMPEYKH